MQNPDIIKLLERRVDMICKMEELKRIIKQKIETEKIKEFCLKKIK